MESILQQKRCTSSVTEWGVQQEPDAIDAYVKYKQGQGHCGISVSACGIYICKSHPFLGASPDECVYDPSSLTEPFGFLEIKCLYTRCNVTPMEATLTAGFCSIKEVSADATVQLRLCENHPTICTGAGSNGYQGKKVV